MRFLKVFLRYLNTKTYNKGWEDGYNRNEVSLSRLYERIREIEKRIYVLGDGTEIIDLNSKRKFIIM